MPRSSGEHPFWNPKSNDSEDIKVLVVSPFRTDLDLVSRAIGSDSLSVDWAFSLFDATARLRSSRYLAVILDKACSQSEPLTFGTIHVPPPVILISNAGQSGPDEVRASKTFCCDFIPRDRLGDSELVDRVVRYAIDIQRREHAFQYLEDQFRHAQKLEVLGRLAGSVAHDFNNLLTVMRGYTDMLLARCHESGLEKPDLEEMSLTVERATGLTSQLLGFCRKEAYEPKPTCVDTVVESIDKMLRRLIGEQIQLKLDLASGDALIHADPGQLEQVIANLAVNSRDAMPEGGSLSISTRFHSSHSRYLPSKYGDRRGWVQILISDTGVGISPAILDRIFEPFFTTKPIDKGTGLGLSTVREIVQKSGGRIEVSSTREEGTTFMMYFPTVEHLVQVLPAASADVGGSQGETLVLVDDDESVRTVAAKMLRSYGYTIHVAESPAAALEMMRSLPHVDLLITDMVMPGMSGLQLKAAAQAIRPQLPVLIVSGYPDENQIGPNDKFISKPFSTKVFVTAVRNILDDKILTTAA